MCPNGGRQLLTQSQDERQCQLGTDTLARGFNEGPSAGFNIIIAFIILAHYYKHLQHASDNERITRDDSINLHAPTVSYSTGMLSSLLFLFGGGELVILGITFKIISWLDSFIHESQRVGTFIFRRHCVV